jgi:hypothetical protein
VPLVLCSVIAVLGAAGLAIRAGYLHQHDIGERGRYVSFFENSAPGYGYIVRNDLGRLYRFDCDFYDFLKDVKRDSIARDCYAPPPGKSRSILLWGDSHAQSFRHGLETAVPPDVAILQVATSGCRPAVRPVFPDARGTCNRSNAFAMQVVHDVRPDLVILAQSKEHETTDWQEAADQIRKSGAKEVLLLGPLPQWDGDLHKVIAREYWDEPTSRVAKHLLASTVATDARLRARQSSSYTFVSLQQALCNGNGCLALVTPDPIAGLMAFDYGHLTPIGSEFVGREILAPKVSQLLAKAR